MKANLGRNKINGKHPIHVVVKPIKDLSKKQKLRQSVQKTARWTKP